MDNIRRMSSQTSSLAHWRKRLCTVFQGPNSGCKSRQGRSCFHESQDGVKHQTVILTFAASGFRTGLYQHSPIMALFV